MDNDIVIPNTNAISRDTGPPQRKKIIASHLIQTVWAANKIKNKYRQKRLGKKQARIFTAGSRFKQVNKKIAEWLKDKGLLDENVPAEKADIGETIDLKKTSNASFAAKNIIKKYRNLARKKPYEKRPLTVLVVKENNDPEDIIDLGDIATLKPNKNAQIEAKKITEKYKDRRQKKKAKTDDTDFTITDSKVLDDDDIDFRVSDSRPADDTDDID